MYKGKEKVPEQYTWDCLPDDLAKDLKMRKQIEDAFMLIHQFSHSDQMIRDIEERLISLKECAYLPGRSALIEQINSLEEAHRQELAEITIKHRERLDKVSDDYARQQHVSYANREDSISDTRPSWLTLICFVLVTIFFSFVIGKTVGEANLRLKAELAAPLMDGQHPKGGNP